MINSAVTSILLLTAAAAAAPPPIILISIDTLRADHLTSYGSRGRPTRNIDRLTQGGTLFAHANSQVPLTLPSHASMLTSTQPFTNGTEDNGHVLGQSALTLAEVLKQRGYSTAAFVGGYVLDRRFGLDQGFDYYDSPFQAPEGRDAESADLKRLGSQVVSSASQWIEKNTSRPFFVFLHLFDLHTPDNLPASVRKRFPGPRYSAELGYVDELLGGFFASLQKQGIYDRALIVFTSDHGEGLGDHGENSHGFFIYQSTLAVPLLFHWPTSLKGYVPRVEEAVSLLGIAPTILEVAGIPPPASFAGKSLLRLARGQKSASPEEVYSESFYGRNHFNTSALSSLRKGRYKYIHAPRPEFYDLEADPRELANLWTSRRSIAEPYAKRLAELRAKAEPSRTNETSPEVLSRLRSLGYLAGSSSRPRPADSGPDPKDRIADYESYRRAVTLSGTNQLSEANRILADILTRDSSLADARVLLALNLQKAGRHDQAVAELRRVLADSPANVPAHYYLSSSLFKLGQQDEAIKELEATLAAASDRLHEWKQITVPAEELLARVLIERKDYAGARRLYVHLLTLDAENYEGHFNLAWLDAREQRLDEAIRHLQVAIRTKPADAPARNALGGLYLRVGRAQEAQTEFTEAVRLDPKSPWPLYNLGLVFRQRGDRQNAAEHFRRALAAQPNFKPAQEALAKLQQDK